MKASGVARDEAIDQMPINGRRGAKPVPPPVCLYAALREIRLQHSCSTADHTLLTLFM